MLKQAKSGFGLFTNKPAITTRFETSSSLNELVPIIQTLRTRTDTIGYDAIKKGSDSVDNAKHNILKQLLTDLDNEITAFNKLPVNKNDHLSDLQEQYQFVKKLLTAVNKLRTNMVDIKVISTQRNKDREALNTFIQYAPTAVVVTVASLTPLSFPVGVIGAYSAFEGSLLTRNLTGLNDLTPRSAILVEELAKKLIDINGTLEYLIQNQSTPSSSIMK